MLMFWLVCNKWGWGGVGMFKYLYGYRHENLLIRKLYLETIRHKC